MKLKHFAPFVCLIAVCLVYACVKSSNPSSTVYDTIYITKTDTVQIPQVIDTPNLTEGLVLYLPFNGSIADSSGLNNTVTAIAGATLGYDMHGYANSAFNSTGNGARLVVANNGSYKVDTAFSLSFDFMIRSYAYYNGGGNYSGLECLMTLTDTSNAEGSTFALGFTNPYLPQNFDFDLNSSTADCNSYGDANGLADTTNFIPQLGAWYNVICTFTNGTVAVYVNGSLVSTKTGVLTSVLFCPNATLVIGGWWSSPTNIENINGEMDEIRMYNRTLTTPQIAYLSRNFQVNSTKLTPGLKKGGTPGIGAN